VVVDFRDKMHTHFDLSRKLIPVKGFAQDPFKSWISKCRVPHMSTATVKQDQKYSFAHNFSVVFIFTPKNKNDKNSNFCQLLTIFDLSL